MTTAASKISIELDSDALETLYRVATCAFKKARFDNDTLSGVSFQARRGKLVVAATTGKALALGTVPGVVLGPEESWHLVLEAAAFLELGKGSKRAREAREGAVEVDQERGEVWLRVGDDRRYVRQVAGVFPDLTYILPEPGAKPGEALGDLMFNPEFFGQAF